MNMGTRIKELRTIRGIKATFVANKIGVSQPLLSMIEREKQNPTIPQLVSLSDFFGVTIDYLVKGENNESNNANFA